MKALVVSIGVLASVLFFSATPAYACSCDPSDPAALVAGGDGAFVGTYLGRTEPDEGGVRSSATPVVNHFTVEQVIKGEIGQTVDVAAAIAGASCGLELTDGQPTGLVVMRSDSGWASSLCKQTSPEAMLALAQPPEQPGSGEPAPGWVLAVSDGSELPLLQILVGAGLLIGALTVVLGIRSRRSGSG